MAERPEGRTYISVSVAVRRSGLSHRVVQECVQRSLVREPLTDADLAELRRIRRLQELGANMPAIEIILHMRRRVLALQADLARTERLSDRQRWPEMEDEGERRLPQDADHQEKGRRG
jgi:hypothetical protein